MSAELPPSPFHEGELAIQRQLGVAERMDAIARKVVRDYMPDQHRTFFAQLPFLVAASVDRQGYPAVPLLAGTPGFAHSPDAKFLQIDRMRSEEHTSELQSLMRTSYPDLCLQEKTNVTSYHT